MTEHEILKPENFFDAMASHYDSYIAQTRFPIFTAEQERRFLSSFIGDKIYILDLGCGTGRTLKLLQEDRKQLFGIDISSKMLEVAAQSHLTVIQASAYKLPFPDSYFEVVYSFHMGFSFCRDESEMESLSRELARVLKAGGRIMMDTVHARFRGTRFTTKWSAGEQTICTTGYGKTENDILPVLEKAGFTDICFYGGYGEHIPLQNGSHRIVVTSART
jgi:ubiquinone/menaquinone biosynthesis C-methylase UbiE